MSITFTDQLDKPSEITAIPNQLLRPIFGASYGFDVPVGGGGGTPAFANQYSVSFDGTDDYMDIPDSTALETTAFTWSAWFYCTAIDKYNIIVNSGTSTQTSNGYVIFVRDNTNKITFGSYSSVDYIASNTTVSANTWYHVAATHESGSDKLYVNGTLEASGSASNFSTTDAANLRIGSSSIFNLYHTGLIDEVAFFNSALSASNVSSIYNSGVPNDISSLSPVGWWRMGDNDGATGTTITNQGSASSIDGTLTNGPTFSTDVPYSNTLSGSFDGTDDYLTANESNLATSGDCTISLWFNSASLPGSGAYDYLFSLTDARVTGKDRAIGIRGTGSDAQIVANTYASGWNLPFTNTSISASTWYHVAVVFTSSSAQVYFNGADKGSTTVATNTIAYTQTVIGSMLYSSANHFNGKIDEVSVFHSALSSTDITAIYNGGVPADISSLSPKGWWRNGDGTGDTDSGGGAPANTDTVGTVANQGSVNTGSGEGNMTGTNGPTFSSSVPS